ncbi:MAG TPA: glycosyltransferase [Candidatus Limnocylindrales bacterium]|nr:glycosyltransferase [Candidatus Limnocylindrales bacterium]
MHRREVYISCIIPTLGRGAVLCDTLSLLLAQTHPAHQIIVVDQTPAHPIAVMRALAAWTQQSLVVWLRQAKPNASRARNAGAQVATGDLLLFLDDDIRIDATFLAAYAQAFVRTGADGICGPVLEGEGKMVEALDRRAFTSELGWLLRFRKNYAHECETSFMMSGNVAVRREVFLNLGGMDENYDRGAHREESDFAMRFRRAGYRFWYSPRCAICHLGPKGVPEGGARDGSAGKDFHYFHHCVGDWYFNLKFCTPRTVFPLLAASLRHFVFNRQTLDRPWRFPFAVMYWIAALPPAIVKRWQGPKLIFTQIQN